MNRSISYTLKKIDKMREAFADTPEKDLVNTLADSYERVVTSPNGVKVDILHMINENISLYLNTLGIR